jgi:hypothetical protein
MEFQYRMAYIAGCQDINLESNHLLTESPNEYWRLLLLISLNIRKKPMFILVKDYAGS